MRIAIGIVINLCILTLVASKKACTKDMKEKEMEAYTSCGERQVHTYVKYRERCCFSELKDYRAMMKAGPDGQPDWVSRKFCNLITAVLVVI